MGVEAILFIIMGAVAIACAVMMLASENAVHSALFLIVNFVCVAFLYLMLEAPFLAMIQIAVYAGAIMVLFLFVIMLLGAEQLSPGEKVRRFPWLAPLGVILAIIFFGVTGVAVLNGDIAGQTPVVDQAKLRIVNAATIAEEMPGSEQDPVFTSIANRAFDVYAGGELLATDLEPRDATTYLSLTPGEYTLVFSPVGTAVEFVKQTLTLEPGQVVTAVLTGLEDETLAVNTFDDSLDPTGRREGRINVYNAYPEAVSLVTIESELFADNRKVKPLITDIPSGEVSTGIDLPEGFTDLTIIRSGTEQIVRDTMNPGDIFGRIDRLNVPRDSAQLLVVSAERAVDGSVEPGVFYGANLVVDTVAVFGSPEALGQMLFIEYLLPFQLVAILLLAAMVGVIVLTQQKEHVPKPSRALRRKVNRPLTSVIAAQTGSDLSTAPRLPEPEQPEQPELAGD